MSREVLCLQRFIFSQWKNILEAAYMRIIIQEI